ncbi:hypothetical protein EJ110_NYTH17610 [Nymphaea thermarum]|nr:hypothetical protein EJ110_NYTH17610 [Nymphaea thermarum]
MKRSLVYCLVELMIFLKFLPCLGLIYMVSEPPAITESCTMNSEKPWIVMVPTAGMCHILLFIRFTATIVEHGFNVIFVATKSTVSWTESHHIFAFLSSSPSVHPLWYDPLSLNPDSSHHNTTDPYCLQFEL